MSDIFLCYRRNDNPQTAWHLAYILNHELRTFLDTHIRGGVPWGEELQKEIEKCVVFICLIGERWLEQNEDGTLRIEGEDDVVRREIELAISLNKKILPVIVGNGAFPNKKDLPVELHALVNFEFIQLRYIPPHFYVDSREVLKRVSELIRAEKGEIYYWWRVITQSIAKNLVVILVSSMVSAGLTGVLMSKTQSKPSTDTPRPIDRMDNVKIGYVENTYPLSYIENGIVQGFTYELCRELVDSIQPGVKIFSIPVYTNEHKGKNRERINAIKEGVIDIECSATSITDKRAKDVKFIGTGMFTQTRFMSPALLKLYDQKGKINFSGKRAIAVEGTTNFDNSDRYYIFSGDKFRTVPSYEIFFESFRKNPPDAEVAFSDDILLAGFLAGYKGPSKYKISHNATPGLEQFGIMIAKGDSNFEERLKNALEQLQHNGKLCELYREWFIDGKVSAQVEDLYRDRESKGIRPQGDLRYFCKK